jgi:hypothetical protein
MPFQIPAGYVFGRQGLVKGAGMQVDALFDNDQPFSDLFGGMAKPDS